MARFVQTSLFVLPLAFLLGCGGPLHYKLASSPKAPGADADVTAGVQAEQNTTLLEVQIRALAPPGRIAEGASHFVLWQRKDSKGLWARVGGLEYDPETRDGKFLGSVPESAFDMSITAEKALDVASPSADVVFSQRVAE